MNNDRKTALDWISRIEGEAGRVREGDLYPRLKTWVNHAAPATVLEIGAGQGICSDKIDLAGRQYTGVELSPFLLDRARELYRRENRAFVSGSAYALPFAADAFDAAFSVAVWHLLEDLAKAASELSRVLKPGGHFLIISAAPAKYSVWTDQHTDTVAAGRRFEGTVRLADQSTSREVLYLHALDEITGSLESAGLKIDALDYFRHFISIQGQKQN